jgi:hypothetical protein
LKRDCGGTFGSSSVELSEDFGEVGLACTGCGCGVGRDGGGAGGFEELYLTGDSLAKKSRNSGSRLFRGLFDEELGLLLSDAPQNQPIVALALLVN